MNSKQRFRARFIFVLIILAAAGLASSLYWTQVVKGKSYAMRATAQYAKPATNLFDRGTIFFASKDGTRPAAAAVAGGRVVYMNPSLMKDSEGAFQAISMYLDLDREEFMRKSAKAGVYEELARRVEDTTAASIVGLRLPGVGAARQTWRTYPGDRLAAHVLGLVGESADGNVQGRYGLERTHESTLKRSQSGASNVFADLFSGIKESVFGDGTSSAGDIVTTLEPTVQGYVENVLAKAHATWKPDSIGAIVMDPESGQIRAAAVLPAFDPNDLSTVRDVRVLSNPLVEHVYEMGSIVKPLTIALGLDTGAISPSFTYDDTGSVTLDGKKISNFDGRARGISSLQDIVNQSLNLGAASIALKAGKEKFGEYFAAFGLTGKTGIDLPNEAASLVGNLKSGRDIEIATASYGQGIAVSPIAMTRALAVLANGGYLVRPHLTQEIIREDNTTEVTPFQKEGPVLSQRTTTEVTRLLVEAVDTALKNGAIKMEHYSVAAKTGTAQIPDPSAGGYYRDRYLHSFFGYFPAYDPQFIVFLYQINPKGAAFASETLVDPFAEIAKFLINYYDIPPDR